MTDHETLNGKEEILSRRELLALITPVLRCEAKRLSGPRFRPSDHESERIQHLKVLSSLAETYSSVLAGGSARGRTVGGEDHLVNGPHRILFENVEAIRDPLDIKQQNRIANQDQGEIAPSEEGGESAQNNPSAKPSTVGESSDPQDLNNSQVGRNGDFMHNPRRESGHEEPHGGRGDRASAVATLPWGVSGATPLLPPPPRHHTRRGRVVPSPFLKGLSQNRSLLSSKMGSRRGRSERLKRPGTVRSSHGEMSRSTQPRDRQRRGGNPSDTGRSGLYAGKSLSMIL